MTGNTDPSHNYVFMMGRVHRDPVIRNEGRARIVTVGIATEHDGAKRVHRVVIQDEFLAQAVYPDLVVDALVHVTGEIDYDDSGAFVSVANRRGSNVHVVGTVPQPQARPAPVRDAAKPAEAPARTTPVAPPASTESPAAHAGTAQDQAPAEPAATPAASVARPATATSAPPPSRGLASLAQSAPASQESEPDHAEDEAPEAPASVAPPVSAPLRPGATVTASAGQPRPLPPGGIARPPVGARPAPVMRPSPVVPPSGPAAAPGPKPQMPTAGPRPGAASAPRPAPRPLGPSPDDDDIPF